MLGYKVNFTAVDETDAMKHHGIKGMKWGVRRTPEQLGHRPSARSSRQSVYESSKGPRKRQAYTKKGYQLTDKELDRRINRLAKEKRYQDLQKEVNSTQMSEGRRFIANAVTTVGAATVSSVATYAIAKAINSKTGQPVVGRNVKGKDFPGFKMD